jgi:hypothetical protein
MARVSMVVYRDVMELEGENLQTRSEELATRLSSLEAEVRVLARRAEGQDAGV